MHKTSKNQIHEFIRLNGKLFECIRGNNFYHQLSVVLSIHKSITLPIVRRNFPNSKSNADSWPTEASYASGPWALRLHQVQTAVKVWSMPLVLLLPSLARNPTDDAENRSAAASRISGKRATHYANQPVVDLRGSIVSHFGDNFAKSVLLVSLAYPAGRRPRDFLSVQRYLCDFPHWFLAVAIFDVIDIWLWKVIWLFLRLCGLSKWKIDSKVIKFFNFDRQKCLYCL